METRIFCPQQIEELCTAGNQDCRDAVKLLGICEYRQRFQTTCGPCSRRDRLADLLIATGAVLIGDANGDEH